MNWYKVFYWVVVADGMKSIFNTFAIIFTVICCISAIGYFVSTSYKSDASKSQGNDSRDFRGWSVWYRAFKNIFLTSVVLMPLFWTAWVLTPTKKDALLILAGGATVTFLTSDSSARGIPAELTLLVRERMKQEIREAKMEDVFGIDTLRDKSKEELIDLLKQKK